MSTAARTMANGNGGAQPVSAEDRLKQLGIELPNTPTPIGAYVEAVQSGRLLFLSGMLPIVNRKPKYVGRIGNELNAESARDAVYTAGLNALAAIKAHLGTLDKVTRVVRLGVFLATAGDFVDHAKVADAVSELFESVFGKDKTSVRIVLGVASLPLGLPVELEVIPEVAE
jgi:enamine deaminase RidA (YjgF/YER057c/UK114 family)